MVKLLHYKTVRYGMRLLRSDKLRRVAMIFGYRPRSNKEIAEGILTKYRTTFEILGRQ